MKKNYHSRSKYHHFDDTPYKDEYQDEVYAEAKRISCQFQLNRIGDIGCGSGYKLIKYFGSDDTLGFEIEPTLSFLKTNFPSRKWELSNFHDPITSQVDVLICADVIEHLVNPDDLLNWINNFDFKYLILSTPDRNKLAKAFQNGPPGNPAHIREWGFDELRQYIACYFDIIEHKHLLKEYWGQLVIAKKYKKEACTNE